MKFKLITILQCLLLHSYMQAQEDVHLDNYLLEQGAFITEGYITNTQKMTLIQDLQRFSGIKRILEIGFNAGHSAELFLTTINCEKLVSFDINTHPYTKVGVEFIRNKFGDRFTFISGDSKREVPEYGAAHPNETFDLIFIDGDHSFTGCLSDIKNCRQLAHQNTLILIDDYVAAVKAAVDISVQRGEIELLDLKKTYDPYTSTINGGDRIWVMARYLSSSFSPLPDGMHEKTL